MPLATLTLLQGLGRLIRTRTDRGVLAVLDPRLTRMSYGRRFLASLPPAPITDDLDDVAKFFAARVNRVRHSFPWFARATNPSSVTTSTFSEFARKGFSPPDV